MAIYIIIFAASTILFRLGDFIKKNQRIYIDIIAILLLCLLAGFRAETIGTDNGGYGQHLIKGAISSKNIKEFYEYSWIPSYKVIRTSDYEIGFTFVVYIISSLFKSIVVTQTFIELLVVLPIYCALRKKGDVPIWFGMLVFMFQFFNGSMNLMRQSIAMAFILLAVTYWMKGDKKKCIVFMICTVLFHTSGLLGILIIFLYEYIGKDGKSKLMSFNKNISISINYMNMVIAIVAGVAVLIGIRFVSAILTQFGLSYYTGYIFGDIHFMPNQIINVLPPIVMLAFSYNNFKNHKSEWAFYVVMMAYVIIAGQFTSVNAFGGRIRLYFMIFAIFAYPLVCKYSRNKMIMTPVMISYLMFYWWYYYVLLGTDQTVPYVMIQ